MSIKRAITFAAILISGKSIEHKLTAAEGLTSDMIVKLVAAEPALMGDVGPTPAEGTLLPETYLFTHGTTRAQILERMKKAVDLSDHQLNALKEQIGHGDAQSACQLVQDSHRGAESAALQAANGIRRAYSANTSASAASVFDRRMV